MLRWPRRHFKRLLRLVAPSWLNISPWRATADPFMPKSMDFCVLGDSIHVLTLSYIASLVLHSFPCLTFPSIVLHSFHCLPIHSFYDLKTCKIRCPIGWVTRQIYEIGRPIGRSGGRRCNWSKQPNTHTNICQWDGHQRGAAASGRSPPLVSIRLAYVGMCIRMLRPIASSDA